MSLPSIPSIRAALAAHAPQALDGELVRVRAAVAGIFRDGPRDTEVLLIRRADRDGDPWSGHMAFPGGRHSAGDRDLSVTAQRETFEEIGLDLARAGERLGWMSDIPAIVTPGMVVRPYFFAVPMTPEFRLNHEVAEVIWAPLGPMFRGDIDTTLPYDHHGQHYDFPAYDVDGHVVWGLTYKMLTTLFELLRTPP